jgi:hypothetical protein
MVGNCLIWEFVGGKFFQPPPPPPGDLCIHHGAPHIAVHCCPVVDLSPGQIRLGQRRLQQILGVRAVPGQHDRYPHQRGFPSLDIITESGLVIVGPRLSVIVHDAHAVYLT